MGLKCGIVGLPNAGKSTIFNALTNSTQAETGNYPFCTIEANKGQVFVPDKRLKAIQKIINSKQMIPASFEFTDIAGLVKGAHQGEGLGNQFLSNIRSVDSLLHVVRAFKDSQIAHVCGEPDPARDIEIVNTELLLSDLEIAEKRAQKIQKTAQTTGDKKLRQELEALKKALDILGKSESLRQHSWSQEELSHLKPLNFISLKPVLYVCNLRERDMPKRREIISGITQSLGGKTAPLAVPCALEAEMIHWTDEEKSEFLKPLGLEEPALHTVIKKSYQQLNLISFFTAGEKEARAWTVSQGALAPTAAGVIHSDFQKGFIRAEVYHCEDLFESQSEKLLKQKGLCKTVGKSYQVRDGDVIHFLFSPA